MTDEGDLDRVAATRGHHTFSRTDGETATKASGGRCHFDGERGLDESNIGQLHLK